jgi:hypothetical protein
MSVKTVIIGVFGVLVLLLGVSAYFLQDNLIRSLSNPKIPYEAYTPPPVPDYTNYDNWLEWAPDSNEKSAAVFYVHDTTYRSSAHWNAPIDDKPSQNLLERVALPNEAGPFAEIGAIYAPKYRQATMFAFFTKKHQGQAARKTAYRDVRRAFTYFLENTDAKKPIILVGYGQGGLHVQGLLLDFFQDDPTVQRRLIAAYVIDHSTPIDLFNYAFAETPACKYTADVRCVVSWNAYTSDFENEIWRKQTRLLVWEENTRTLKEVSKRPLLCTNPLNWTLTDDLVSNEEHLGAATLTGQPFSQDPAVVQKAVDVQCVEGIAMLSEPTQRWLRRPKQFGAQWAPLDYNLFYQDLRVNAAQRTEALLALMEIEDKMAPPMSETFELEEAPINKVPKL